MKELTVQWQAGNDCNFKCDYCHHSLNSGSRPFATYEKLSNGLLNLIKSAVGYDLIHVEFQGGEPTVSESIRQLLTASVDPRLKYQLHTNASADLSWWQQAIVNCSKLILAWHYKSDIDHFKSVVDLSYANNVPCHIVVNADVDHWEHAVAAFEMFKAFEYSVSFKTLFSNYQRGNNEYFNYNHEQWSYYVEASQIEVPQNQPVEVQIQWTEQTLYDNYLGHLCWAGVDQIVIGYNGHVYRGWCHAYGQGLGNIYSSPVVLYQDATVCPKSICKNGFDRQAKKSNNSWGIS